MSTNHQPITILALISRLRRAHNKLGETFHIARGVYNPDLGNYFVVDAGSYMVRRFDSADELAEHARHVGVLAAHEMVGS